MDMPDFSMVQESLSATLAKVAMMKAQLSSIKDMLATKEREFETIRQENAEAGADEMINRAMAILRQSTSSDIGEISAAIQKFSKTLPCAKTADDLSTNELPPVPFTESK